MQERPCACPTEEVRQAFCRSFAQATVTCTGNVLAEETPTTPRAETPAPNQPPTDEASCAGGVGNPIQPGTGNKIETENDYQATLHGSLLLSRYYNSRSDSGSGSLGPNWRHSYERWLAIYQRGNGNYQAVLQRPTGRTLRFVRLQSEASWSNMLPGDGHRLVPLGGPDSGKLALQRPDGVGRALRPAGPPRRDPRRRRQADPTGVRPPKPAGTRRR